MTFPGFSSLCHYSQLGLFSPEGHTLAGKILQGLDNIIAQDEKIFGTCSLESLCSSNPDWWWLVKFFVPIKCIIVTSFTSLFCWGTMTIVFCLRGSFSESCFPALFAWIHSLPWSVWGDLIYSSACLCFTTHPFPHCCDILYQQPA